MNKSKVLLEILDEIKNLPAKDQEGIKEFIENNEWGIALEIICSAVLQEKLMINKSTYEKIALVGNEMMMESCLWIGISRLLY